MSLLISALHYSWKTREWQSFETTYLSHKIECISLANSRLNDIKAADMTNTVRLISTLCVVEVSLVGPALSPYETYCLYSCVKSGFGNLIAARSHFDGLMAILDTIESQHVIIDLRKANSNQIIAQYIAV